MSSAFKVSHNYKLKRGLTIEKPTWLPTLQVKINNCNKATNAQIKICTKHKHLSHCPSHITNSPNA